MGLLSAGIFQGLGAGVSAFGGQMMRGVEKEQDEAMLQQRARVLAEIQRESAKNQRQDALEFDTDPANVARRTEAARTTALAAGKTAREVEMEGLNDAPLNDARRAKAKADADAAKKIQDDQTIADAANPELLKARSTIKLADPQVAATIDQMRQSIRESGARSGLLATQTTAAKMALKDQERLGKLYDAAESALADPNLSDEDRAKKVTTLMQQATMIKSKNAPAGAGRDPQLDTVTVEEEVDDGSGKKTKTTRKEVRRPGAGGGKPNMTEAQAHAEAAAAVAQGAPADAVNARLQGLGFNPLPGKKPAAAKSAEPGKAAPPAVESRPAPDAMAQTVAAELAPVVEQYKTAQAQLAAASKSGDATSLARYAQAVQALRTTIERQANDRLGNGAQRYLSSLGL